MTKYQELLDRIDGQNVGIRFLQTVDSYRDIVAVRSKDDTGQWIELTFGELRDRVAGCAAGLRELGVGPGDRIVIMLTNRPEYHIIDLAALFLGATPVSIYNSSAPDQIRYMVNHCSAKVAVVEDAFLPRFAKVADSLPTVEHIAVVDGDTGAGAGSIAVGPFSSIQSAAPLDLDAEADNASLGDLATVIYTSGTTGDPKGVSLTHRNVCWTLESIAEAMTEQTDWDTLAGKRHLSYLPMAHIFERLIGHYYMAFLAVEVNCCPDTTKLADYVREVRPHLLIGVPRVWEKFHAGVMAALAADPEKAQKVDEAIEAAKPIVVRRREGTATDEDEATYEFLDQVAFAQIRELLGLSEARVLVSGAAPLRADVQEFFAAVGVPLSEGYGLSETTAASTWAQDAKPGHVGRAIPGVSVKIADDGEVMLHGGNVFDGYLDAPDKTAEVLEDDGWFHTGDIGELDDDGFLRIVDRKKELIITAGGKNISPANLESALKSIPLVGQACAVGDQRPFVGAIVVLDPDAAAVFARQEGLEGADATLAALAQNPKVIESIESALPEAMANFNNAESVKQIVVLGEEWLPDSEVLTPTSKLKRRGIHARFAAEIDSLYN